MSLGETPPSCIDLLVAALTADIVVARKDLCDLREENDEKKKKVT